MSEAMKPRDSQFYAQAAEWARDDAHHGIHRTDEEVQAEAERLQAQAEKQQRVEALATAFHEQWRETRRTADGYEPRVKETKDQEWIEAHGANEVDIANTDYSDLPSDWQEENRAAAEVIVRIMDERGSINLEDDQQRLAAGEEIHNAWLERNDWARGGELDQPFAQLPPEEQAKDIDQLVVAQELI